MGSEFTDVYDFIMMYLPAIILLAIVQLVLMLTALIHALKYKNFKTGNLTLWVLMILLVNIIGPVLYFVIGRGEEREDEDE